MSSEEFGVLQIVVEHNFLIFKFRRLSDYKKSLGTTSTEAGSCNHKQIDQDISSPRKDLTTAKRTPSRKPLHFNSTSSHETHHQKSTYKISSGLTTTHPNPAVTSTPALFCPSSLSPTNPCHSSQALSDLFTKSLTPPFLPPSSPTGSTPCTSITPSLPGESPPTSTGFLQASMKVRIPAHFPAYHVRGLER